MRYYRRFPGDYANDTRHLSFAEHGAYTLMLDWCYANEKPLPSDPEEVCRIVCAETKEERRAVGTILAEFFELKTRGFVQARVKREISRSAEKNRVNALNGRKGGIKRQANAKRSLESRIASSDSRLQTPDKEEKKEAPNPAVPEIVPVGVWLAFVEMRRKIRHPLTGYAGELIRRKLRDLAGRGFDPVQILENSIANGWRDVFEPKEGKADGKSASFHEQRSRKSAAAIDRVLDSFEKAPGDIQRALPPADH